MVYISVWYETTDSTNSDVYNTQVIIKIKKKS